MLTSISIYDILIWFGVYLLSSIVWMCISLYARGARKGQESWYWDDYIFFPGIMTWACLFRGIVLMFEGWHWLVDLLSGRLIKHEDNTEWKTYHEGTNPYQEPSTTRTWYIILFGKRYNLRSKTITWDKWID